MIHLSFKRFQTTGVLTLSGELLSAYASDFKSVLMVALDNSERLVVDFKRISKLDKAYVQLFCVALGIAKSLKKTLIFNSGRLRQKIKETCVNCSEGCGLFEKNICLLAQ